MADLISGQLVIAITGELQLPSMQIATEVRAGVDGESHFYTGFHGEPQEVITAADFLNWNQAENAYRVYLSRIGDVAFVRQATFAWVDIGYLVLGVRKIALRNMFGAVGGIRGGGTLLRCAWTLVPKYKEPK